MRRTSQFTVNYLISKDTSEVMLDMTFGEINYHEWNGAGTRLGDAADVPGPVRALLNEAKTATIFIRVRPADLTVTFGGARELVNQPVDAYYAAADRDDPLAGANQQ